MTEKKYVANASIKRINTVYTKEIRGGGGKRASEKEQIQKKLEIIS